MRTLIAVKSCWSDMKQGCHDTILKTWGKQVDDLRFFIGLPYDGLSLEKIAHLDVADDYDSLPQKTRKILQWSLGRDYDYTFLCDVDTFLIPYKLFQTKFQNYDYSGRIGSEHTLGVPFRYKDGRGQIRPKCYTWASGGFGYFLSRKAAEYVVKAVIDPKEWAEDVHVGDVLGPLIATGKVAASNLEHFENEASWHYPAHRLGWDRVTMQAWMEAMYAEHNK